MKMDRVHELANKVDGLTLRERVFVLAAILAVVGGLWEALLAAPLQAREQRASLKVDNLSQRLDQLNESMSATADGMTDGTPDRLERLQALRRRLEETEESVRIFTSDLVDPTQMRRVLEDLLHRQGGLKLVSMSNLEVESLVEDAEGSELAEDAPQLYRHGLVVVMEGSFLDCLGYLEAVEGLPWQLYWGRLELQASDFPVNRILIELHTLSLEEEWIGV